MARALRKWSALRSNVRDLIRDTGGGQSPPVYHWSDGALLTFWNTALDLRFLQLAAEYEGWGVKEITTPLSTTSTVYDLPAGQDRVARVLLRFVNGSTTTDVPLERDELADVASTKPKGSVISYRLLGDKLVLSSVPSNAPSGTLLVLEVEDAPPHFTDDNSALPADYPAALETVLVYDTALIALGSEQAAEGEADQASYATSLARIRDELLARLNDYIMLRSRGVVAGRPFYLGD